MMKRIVILAISFLYSTLAYSISVSIHIYADKTFSSVILAPLNATYILEGDGKRIDSCTSSSVYSVSIVNDSLVQVKNLDRVIGIFSRIRLRGYGPRNQFFLKLSSEKNNRLYDDDISISADKPNLKLLSIIDLEHYVSGVVQGEAGLRRPPEYYKVQAIICRTYALNNLARHINDGFELCDLVHCQVYNGVSKNPDILNAVEATKGIVIVDANNQLINAAFFSNCGGQTLNSEDVWNSPLPYLKSRPDTFCLHQPAAVWQKLMLVSEWNNYLTKKEKGLKCDTTKSYYDTIPISKRVYLYDKGYLIPLKEIRGDLNLHSTFFSITKTDNTVTLDGRGYGHRVGLCQEGAIHMTQTGYNYQQVLHFYYTGVQLIDYTLLPSSGFN
jgi:stage II sporulation protein D